MDIGQQKPGAKHDPQPVHRPFARPKQKRRRTLTTKPAAICVRQNPDHYILDFSEQSNRVEKLLHYNIVSDKRFISVVGLPGCGKSVILRAVAYNRAVQDKFREGIFFIPLSVNTTRKLLFDHLAEILEKAGFPTAAAELRRHAAVEGDAATKAAINTFATTISDRHMLIILDDLNENPAPVYAILLAILDALKRGKMCDCRLISSTRSVELAKAFGSSAVLEVTLPEPTSEISRAIMCSHAGFDRAEFDASCAKDENLIFPVLQKCGGLPLALAVAGGAVKRLLSNGKTTEEREKIWGHYRTYLCGSFDQFGQISGVYNGLAKCVGRVAKEREWRTDLSVLQVMGALGVAPDKAWLPYQVLQRLWGLKRKEDVITVVRPLHKMCLVARARRGSSVGILVPDIVLEYCRYEARSKGELKKWHLKLLKSYVDQGQKFAAVVQVTVDEGGVKWERSGDEDDYLKQYLKHHVDAIMGLEPSPEEIQTAKQANTTVQEKFFKPLQTLEQERA